MAPAKNKTGGTTGSNQYVLAALAANPNATEAILEELSKSDSQIVRWAVLRNDHLPLDRIDRSTLTEEEWIILLARPDCPVEVVREALDANGWSLNVLLAAHDSENTGLELRSMIEDKIMEQPKHVIEDLATNLVSSESILIMLGTQDEYRDLVLDHPRCPEVLQAMVVLSRDDGSEF